MEAPAAIAEEQAAGRIGEQAAIGRDAVGKRHGAMAPAQRWREPKPLRAMRDSSARLRHREAAGAARRS